MRGLSYPGMLGNARQLKNQVVGLAMDEEGCCRGAGGGLPHPPGQAALPHPTLQNPHHGHHEPGAARGHHRHRPPPRSVDRRG